MDESGILGAVEADLVMSVEATEQLADYERRAEVEAARVRAIEAQLSESWERRIEAERSLADRLARELLAVSRFSSLGDATRRATDVLWSHHPKGARWEIYLLRLGHVLSIARSRLASAVSDLAEVRGRAHAAPALERASRALRGSTKTHRTT